MNAEKPFSSTMLQIINYQAHYAKQIADLFCRSVQEIDSSFYNEQQKQAWASATVNMQQWQLRLEQKQPLLAILNNKLVGFVELEFDGHIDCLYVEPQYQGKTIGSQLLQYVEQLAKQRRLTRLYAEVSNNAVKLFEKHDFKLVAENHAIRNGVVLINYKMQKFLN